MTEPTGTVCTTVSGGVVDDCSPAPTPYESGGLPALLWASTPGLLVLLALGLTPFARVRAVARAVVAGLLLVTGFVLAGFAPIGIVLLLAGALMVGSAVMAHRSSLGR